MKIYTVTNRLRDLLEDGVSKDTKIAYRINGELKYLEDNSCEIKDKECNIVYFTNSNSNKKQSKITLDDFLEINTNDCNRCSHGDVDCDYYDCSTRVSILSSSDVDYEHEMEFLETGTLYDIDDITYNNDLDMLILETINTSENI